MRRKHLIVMLTTEKASNIILLEDRLRYDSRVLYHSNMDQKAQHLYILSDEEIKEEDWILWNNSNSIERVKIIGTDLVNFSTTHLSGYIENCKKIIATTNLDLGYWKEVMTESGGDKDTFFNLSTISQDFIEAYIKAYNEGNPIIEVMVEYEVEVVSTMNPDKDIERIKLRSDNTIFISRVKEEKYSREEVLDIIKSYNRVLWYSNYKEDTIVNSIDWFNKNYPKH